MTNPRALGLLFVLFGSFLFGGDSVPTVTGAAVWHPSETVLKDIHDACQKPGGTSVDTCFAGQMKKAGASAEALQFSEAMHNEAFLSRFIPGGGPDIAFVFYPFRANTLDGCLLVNTNGKWVNLEVPPHSIKAELEKSSVYREIASAHPNVTLWPSDRGDRNTVKIKTSSRDHKQFLAEYSLRECHACQPLATVWLRYDFGAGAEFLGAHLQTIVKAQP